MGMNALENLTETLEQGSNEILVDAELAKRARLPLDRMVNFAESSKLHLKGNA